MSSPRTSLWCLSAAAAASVVLSATTATQTATTTQHTNINTHDQQNKSKNNNKKYNTVPRVSWEWQPLRATPTVSSNYGAASLSGAQHRVDMQFIGVGPITMAPWNGNFANSTMRIGTVPATTAAPAASMMHTVKIDKASWTPCEGVRSGKVVCDSNMNADSYDNDDSNDNNINTKHGRDGPASSSSAAAVSECDAVNSIGVRRDRRSLIQKWTFSSPSASSSTATVTSDKDNAASSLLSVEMFLDGPYFFRCDGNPAFARSCGWGTSVPVDRANFERWLDTTSLPGTTLMWTRPNETSTIAWRASHPTWSVSALWTSRSTAAHQTNSVDDDCKVTSTVLGFDHYYDAEQYTGYGFNATATVAPHAGCTLWWATAVDETKEGALRMIAEAVSPSNRKTTGDVYDEICSDWMDAFGQAFNPNKDRHFSGNLPLLETKDKKIEALYGWAATALMAMEREIFLSFPRVFPISEGESNSFTGVADMGGSGQFIWDMSYNSVTQSLLEPEGAKTMLRHILSNGDFTSHPFGTPQTWDAYVKYPSASGAGMYCFDAMVTFFYVQNYVANTGDVAFLTEPIPNFPDCAATQGCTDPNQTTRTPLDSLRRLAWSWQAYPASDQSKYLVNYGNNKRSFLEVISTYRGVVPSINAANAGMLLSLARLLETVPSLPRAHPHEIEYLRGNATKIAEAVVQYLYRPDGGWYFPVQTADSNGTEVKAITETVYIPIFAGLVGANASTQHDVLATQFPLPDHVRSGMVRLMREEMLGNGWPRAISLRDPTMSRINCMGGMAGLPTPAGHQPCNITDLVRMRSDWSATGSFAGNAGATVDAMATLEQGFDTALFLLHNYSIIADPDLGTMPAQGMAVLTPPWMTQYLHNNNGIPPPARAFAGSFPEFFDEKWRFWTFPRTSRNVQGCVSSIVDAVIRSIFGWRPDWSTLNVDDVHDEHQLRTAIDRSFFARDTPRVSTKMSPVGKEGGTADAYVFSGTLRNVRLRFTQKQNAKLTNVVFIDISIDEKGKLSWLFSKH